MPLPQRWASTHYPGHNQHIPGTTSYLRSRTFQSYFNMITRCEYPNHVRYPDYGGRGIRVCKSWLLSFQSFLLDMGHRPKGYTLDRINVNGPYSASNCQWATVSDQNRNKRTRKRAA